MIFILEFKFSQMNHSDLNITLYEMYDGIGCALYRIKIVFLRFFKPEFEGGGIWTGGGFGENYPDPENKIH